MAIQWNDAMSVGYAAIDDEHKQLIKLINDAGQALEQRENREALLHVLDELVQYTRDHFAREEIIQLKIKYPDYVEHKLEHQELVQKLMSFTEHFKAPPAEAEVEIEAEDEVETKADEAPATDADADAVSEADGQEETSLVENDTDELVELLRHWIIDHVLQTDRKMKPYLKARG